VRQADVALANKKKAEDKSDFKSINWDRNCTDIIPCILFILALCSMIAITAYGLVNGSPAKFLVAFDSMGSRCGEPLQGPKKDIDFTDYKYKHYIGVE